MIASSNLQSRADGNDNRIDDGLPGIVGTGAGNTHAEPLVDGDLRARLAKQRHGVVDRRRNKIEKDHPVLVEDRRDRLDRGQRPPQDGEHEDEGHEHRGDVAQDAEVAWLFHQSFTLKTFMKTEDARMTRISVSRAMVDAYGKSALPK